MFKVFKSTFFLNTLGVFIAFIFAYESVWSSFVYTGHPEKLSAHSYMSIVMCLFCFLLILWRWKRIGLFSRILSVLLCIVALLGPFACLVTYIDWLHRQIEGDNHLTQEKKYFAIFGGLCSSSVKWQMSNLSMSFSSCISAFGNRAGLCNMSSMDVSISRFSEKAISQFEHSRPLCLLEK